MTAPAPISSEYDNTRLERAFWNAANRATGYRRALINYALSMASNLPVDPTSALASRGNASGIGDGSRADLMRLARELQAGVEALNTGVLELEQPPQAPRHGIAPGDRQMPAAAPQAGSAADTATLPSSDTRRDLLRLAGQAARVQQTARRAARDIPHGTGDRRGILRSLMAALGMALLRGGLALSAPTPRTSGAHPTSAPDLDWYVLMGLRQHLDQMRTELATTSARLDALVAHRGTTSPEVRNSGSLATAPHHRLGSATPRMAAPGPAPGPAGVTVPANTTAGARQAPGPGSPETVLRMELAGAGQHPVTATDAGELQDHMPGGEAAIAPAGSTHDLDGVA
jgi:hypothetical protein